jgi:hypothetical protein
MSPMTLEPATGSPPPASAHRSQTRGALLVGSDTLGTSGTERSRGRVALDTPGLLVAAATPPRGPNDPRRGRSQEEVQPKAPLTPSGSGGRNREPNGEDFDGGDGSDDEDEDEDDDDDDDDVWYDGEETLPLTFPAASEWPAAGETIWSKEALIQVCDATRRPRATVFAFGELIDRHAHVDEELARTLLSHPDPNIAVDALNGLSLAGPELVPRAAGVITGSLGTLAELDAASEVPWDAIRVETAIFALELLGRTVPFEPELPADIDANLRRAVLAAAGRDKASSVAMLDEAIAGVNAADGAALVPHVIVGLLECDLPKTVSAGVRAVSNRLRDTDFPGLTGQVGSLLSSEFELGRVFATCCHVVWRLTEPEVFERIEESGFFAEHFGDDEKSPVLATMLRPCADEKAARRASLAIDDESLDELEDALADRDYETVIAKISVHIAMASRLAVEDEPKFAPIARAWEAIAVSLTEPANQRDLEDDALFVWVAILVLGLSVVVRGRWPYRTATLVPRDEKAELDLLTFDGPWLSDARRARSVAGHAPPSMLEELTRSTDDWVRWNVLTILAVQDPDRHLARFLRELPDWRLDSALEIVFELAHDRALGALYALASTEDEALEKLPDRGLVLFDIASIGTSRSRSILETNYDDVVDDGVLDLPNWADVLCRSGTRALAKEFFEDFRAGEIDLGPGPDDDASIVLYEGASRAYLGRIAEIFGIEVDIVQLFDEALRNGASFSDPDAEFGSDDGFDEDEDDEEDEDEDDDDDDDDEAEDEDEKDRR